MDALLASVSALADLDTDNDAAVVKMGKKASWQASVIGKLEHTLYLVQFVSLQSQAILADKEGYIQPIKPAVSAIQQALRTADPAQIATAYASFQPNTLKWMVKNEVDLPTEAYLRQSGLLDQDRRTEEAKIHDLRSTENQKNTLAMVPGDVHTKKPCVDKPLRLPMVAIRLALYSDTCIS